MTQRGKASACNMAEADITDSAFLEDEHNEMPFRLGDIVLDRKFGDLHPSLAKLDKFRKEWKFQFKLLRHEWGQAHYLTMLTGVAAFLMGAISPEIFGGGDPTTTGVSGLSAISGFSFFQLVLSGILWLWFFVQISVNFPVMKGHIVNIILIWASIFGSQIVLHINSPNFPLGADFGDALGGIILASVGFFFTYFFWKAVSETRDLHVQENHVHTDVRIMEEAMAEHSLFTWSILVIFWDLMMLLNGWSGAHFIADRVVADYPIYFLHLITGVLLIYILMHILWFPQRMLGEDARIKTHAAFAADADLLEGVIVESEGNCPSCDTMNPISRSPDGEPMIDCPTEDCNRRGIPGQKCDGCDNDYPSRHSCIECGVNSPVVDYLSDGEAW